MRRRYTSELMDGANASAKEVQTASCQFLRGAERIGIPVPLPPSRDDDLDG